MSQIEALRTAILSLNGPVFAVLDGAQFDNLPETLMFAGIEARCLYLDRGDNHPERLVTAPYMVGPLEGEVLDQVLSASPRRRPPSSGNARMVPTRCIGTCAG